MRSNLLFLLVSVITLYSSLSKANVLIINASDMSFSPNTGTINLGDTVMFHWTDGVHTTTSVSVPAGAAMWDEVLSDSNPMYMYIPAVAGSYSYKCIPHESMGMTGSFTVNSVTSIDETVQKNSLNIFPNPAQNELNLSMEGVNVISVFITDIQGNIIMKHPTGKTTTVKLDIAAVSNGLYYIHVENKEGLLISRKLTIIR